MQGGIPAFGGKEWLERQESNLDGSGQSRVPYRSATLQKERYRGGRIRTCGPLRPRQMRYQAALRPDGRWHQGDEPNAGLRVWKPRSCH